MLCLLLARLPLLSLSQDPTDTQKQQNNMEQTTARLRKTFQYPTDNDSDDSLPEALDEEGVSLSFKLSLLPPNRPP